MRLLLIFNIPRLMFEIILILFLSTPPQRRFPRLQTFRPLESPDVFGGRAASVDQPDVPVGFYPSEPNAYRRL